MSTSTIDYDAIAKKVQASNGPVNYDTLADLARGTAPAAPAVGTPEFKANLQKARGQNATYAMREADAAAQNPNPLTNPPAPDEGNLHTLGRQVMGNAYNMVKGAGDLFQPPQNPDEEALMGASGSLGGLPLAAKRMLVDPSVNEYQNGASKLGAIPVVGPMAAQMGRDAGSGNTVGAVAGAATLGSMLGGVPKAGASLADAALTTRTAGQAANAHTAAIKDLANTMGAESTEPFLNRAKDQIIADVGGKEPIVGRSPEGAAARWHQAAEISAAKQGEFVHSNYINQNPNAPISIVPVAKQIEGLLTSGFERTNPELASALQKGMETGVIPADQAYALKAEMNRWYRENLSDTTAFKPRDAKQIGDVMRSQLNQTFGDEFSQADRLQGQIGAIRDLAKTAADRATLESTKTPPITPGEVVHGLHRPISGTATAALRRIPGFRELTTDQSVANAIKDLQVIQEGIRPEVAPEVAANLRQGSMDRSAFLNPQQPPKSSGLAPDAPLFPPEAMSGSPQPTPTQTMEARQRLGQFSQPPRGINDQPLDSYVAPSDKIYEPPVQRLGDRGIPHDEGVSAINKLAYDATKASTQPWKPDLSSMGNEPGIVRRIMNPHTQRVESWIKTEGGKVYPVPMESPVSFQVMRDMEKAVSEPDLRNALRGKAFDHARLNQLKDYIGMEGIGEQFPRLKQAVDEVLSNWHSNNSMLH